MSKFDRSKVKEIHKDISDALALIAKKHGMLSLSTGTLSFNENKFTVRVTGISSLDAFSSITTPVISARTSATTPLSDYIGKKFISKGVMFTVTDIKMSRPKYPISAVNAAGTGYKFTPSAVAAGLIK
jgi:hypothetical protein